MMHHKMEIRNGGETTPENCILLCQDCHKAEHGGAGVGSPDYWYDVRYRDSHNHGNSTADHK
jgi:hypothetical protein